MEEVYVLFKLYNTFLVKPYDIYKRWYEPSQGVYYIQESTDYNHLYQLSFNTTITTFGAEKITAKVGTIDLSQLIE